MQSLLQGLFLLLLLEAHLCHLLAQIHKFVLQVRRSPIPSHLVPSHPAHAAAAAAPSRVHLRLSPVSSCRWCPRAARPFCTAGPPPTSWCWNRCKKRSTPC